MSALLEDFGVVPAIPATDAVASAHGLGVVSVHALGFGNTTAWCSCGWAGRRRLLKAMALQDAWTHSMQERCDVSHPLVLAW
jgi:hypothetical protein